MNSLFGLRWNHDDAQAQTGWLARARAFLQARPDREHEIAFNRVAMCFSFAAYLNLSWYFGFHEYTRRFAGLDYCLIAYSIGLCAHMLRWPGESVARRVIGIVGDLSVVAFPLYLGDHTTAFLFPLFLWVIFGYGFRFGVSYIFLATAMAVVQFSAVIWYTPFWREHPSLSVGLLLGLIVLPLYVSVLIRQLSEAKRLAEEASKAKTLFLASVSHELRTPLNAIIGLSDLLADSRLEEEQIDMSRVIGRSGRSLLSLINSILDISRMECGYPNAKVGDIDLYAFLGGLRDMLEVQAQAKKLPFMLHIRPSTPRHVTLNPRHIEEILVNLAGNAIKFTEKGYVLIVVDAAPIDETTSRLRFEVVDTGIGIAPEARGRIFDRFSQADETIIDRFGGTGLGLAIVKQLVAGAGGTISVDSEVGKGSVFRFEVACEAQSRANNAVRRDDILLLSSDARLAERIASQCPAIAMISEPAALAARLGAARDAGRRHPVVIVDARGAPGAGAPLIRDAAERVGDFGATLIGVFDSGAPPISRDIESMLATSFAADADDGTLERAIEIATANRIQETASVNNGDSARPRVPLHVLVAEDNRTNQLVLQKMLERDGHSVVVVADGQAAIERLSDGKFDLCLMDVNMPVMNGVDASKLYQFSVPSGKRTPIIALTADATRETERRCLDAGMIACMTKPIEAARLTAWLDDFAADRAGGNVVAEAAAPAEPARDEALESIDDSALRDLKTLGGDEFVSEIVDQFLADAALVLRNLHEAVEDGDVQKFRDEAHALRSCAANVGAQKVFGLCLEWRSIGARELAVEGEMRVRRLEVEFERAREALVSFQRSETY